MEATDESLRATVFTSHPSGHDWIRLDEFRIKMADLTPAADESQPEGQATSDDQKKDLVPIRLGNLVAEGILRNLVRVQLARGPKVKGKDTYRIKIVNESPMILNGLALGSAEDRDKSDVSVFSGFCLPPAKTLTVPASSEMVTRLHMKDGVRIFAADLSGL